MVRSRKPSPGSPALHPDKGHSPGCGALKVGAPIQIRQHHLETGFGPYRVVPGSQASARGHVLGQERCPQI